MFFGSFVLFWSIVFFGFWFCYRLWTLGALRSFGFWFLDRIGSFMAFEPFYFGFFVVFDPLEDFVIFGLFSVQVREQFSFFLILFFQNLFLTYSFYSFHSCCDIFWDGFHVIGIEYCILYGFYLARVWWNFLWFYLFYHVTLAWYQLVLNNLKLK